MYVMFLTSVLTTRRAFWQNLSSKMLQPVAIPYVIAPHSYCPFYYTDWSGQKENSSPLELVRNLTTTDETRNNVLLSEIPWSVPCHTPTGILSQTLYTIMYRHARLGGRHHKHIKLHSRQNNISSFLGCARAYMQLGRSRFIFDSVQLCVLQCAHGALGAPLWSTLWLKSL